MLNTKYNSVRKTKSKKEKKVSKFASDSFEAIKPFINVFDCGLKVVDHVFHLITKESWRLHRRHKAGERNLLYEDGMKFNPYLDIIRNIYGVEHVQRHMEEHQTTYFTSGKKGLGLFYLDIDAHHPWQTDELQARAVLEKLFPVGYFRPSGRGQNGYLKIRYASITEFNDLADRLQETLKRLFLQRGILCDIEVKGTITHGEKSGRLGKLPFNTTNRRADSWNYEELEKFKACAIVETQRIDYIVRQLSFRIDEEKVQQFAEYKKSLMGKPVEKLKNEPPSTAGMKPKVTEATPVNRMVEKPVLPAVRVALPDVPFASDDAFARNQQDIRPFVRAFFREHRRFPMTEEALDWIKANGRYSGEWKDREERRAKRVGQILAYTQQTFDPKMLSSGESKPVSLDVRKFSWWVRQQFGSVMTARFFNYREVDPRTMTAPMTEVSVPARFVATFLAVADFCLREDPLHNKAVPTNRIKKLWEMVKGGAPWNQKYFQLVRERLHRMGVIRICDRNHDNGKAWRWDAGERFPSEDYREEQRECQERCRLRGEAGSFRDLVNVKRSGRDCKVHNTLYKDACQILGHREKIAEVRGPP